MGVGTDFIRKQTPHLTPVIIIGGCAVLIPAFTVFASGMDSLGANPNATWCDFLKVISYTAIAGLSGLQAFMNRTYGRYLDARDGKLDTTSTAP